MLKNLHQTLSVNGRSGQTYTFHQFSFDDFDDVKGALPEYGGIYIFTHAISGQEQNPVYCGKTEDFSTRYDNHHKENCIRRRGANRISIMKVDRSSDRDAIETDILGEYDFPCNTQHNC